MASLKNDRVEVIRDIETFGGLREEWNDLWTRSGVGWAWLTHEWLISWWRSFGGEARLLVPTVWVDGRLVAAAPTMVVVEKVKRLDCRVLRFIQNAITPRSQLLLDVDGGGTPVALWGAVRSCSEDWDMAALEKVPQDGLFDTAWTPAAVGDGMRFDEAPDRQSPYIDLSRGYDGLLKTISAKMRENIRASYNRLSRLGDVGVEPYMGAGDLQGALEICFAVSTRSWKGQDGLDLGSRPGYRAFYEALAQDESLREHLYIWILELDGHPVAFNIVIRSGAVITGLATDYDLAAKRCSPGKYLMSRLLEDASAVGLKGLDMAGEAYDYKLSWTKESLSHSQFCIHNRGLKSRLLYALRDVTLPRFGTGQAPPS